MTVQPNSSYNLACQGNANEMCGGEANVYSVSAVAQTTFPDGNY
jgi:hypothetical protein